MSLLNRRRAATAALVVLLSVAASDAAAQRTDLDYPFGFSSFFGPGGIVRRASEFAVFLIIISAVIFISIGAYFYFAAAGNAKLAQEGKELLTRSLFGLILGFIAYLLLKTISPQFVTLPTPVF